MIEQVEKYGASFIPALGYRQATDERSNVAETELLGAGLQANKLTRTRSR